MGSASRLSRREFLRWSTAGTAALAASLVLPALAEAGPGGNGKGRGGGGGGGGGGGSTIDYLEFGTAAGAPLGWHVKTSDSKVGPGPNYFSNRADDVFVDDDGLHLTITKHGSRWWATEVISDLRVGYGRYEFWLASRVDALDPNAVLGLFTWNNAPDFANREIDIEFARWGDAVAETNGQYVVQPYSTPGNLHGFVQPAVAQSYHRFDWSPDSVAFASYGITSTQSPTLITEWRYSGGDVPIPEQPADPPPDTNARMNLWLYRGRSSQKRRVEVVISDFKFQPP